MLKTEVICESCNSHFIVVNLEETVVSYCPFCAFPILDESDLNGGEVEE